MDIATLEIGQINIGVRSNEDSAPAQLNRPFERLLSWGICHVTDRQFEQIGIVTYISSFAHQLRT